MSKNEVECFKDGCEDCQLMFRSGYRRQGCELHRLWYALEESVKLQSHYAGLLNMYDSGERLKFENADAWLDRLLRRMHEEPKRKNEALASPEEILSNAARADAASCLAGRAVHEAGSCSCRRVPQENVRCHGCGKQMVDKGGLAKWCSDKCFDKHRPQETAREVPRGGMNFGEDGNE